jgi:tripartite ATP-independent transporter DctP family solute receptor
METPIRIRLNIRIINMKKALTLLFITSLTITIITLFFTGCGKDGKDTGSYEFKLAETHNKDYPTTRADEYFARLVKERSKGKINIKVYHSKQLGEEKAVIEQVQAGTIDFTRVSISPMANFYKPLNVLQMPYLYKNEVHMWKVLNSSIGDKLLAAVEKSGFAGLCYFSAGARSFYTREKVITPQDLKGLKIRVQQSALMVDMVKSFGAVAQPMPFGEVYSAIQTSVIDGAENNWPSYFSTGHYEVATCYILDEHTRVPEILVASKRVDRKSVV